MPRRRHVRPALAALAWLVAGWLALIGAPVATAGMIDPAAAHCVADGASLGHDGTTCVACPADAGRSHDAGSCLCVPCGAVTAADADGVAWAGPLARADAGAVVLPAGLDIAPARRPPKRG
jgi:hypothetical protein